MTDIAKLAAGLTDAQREAWDATILTLGSTSTAPRRSAFMRGYYGHERPPNSTNDMQQAHKLGLAVRAHLASQEPRNDH